MGICVACSKKGHLLWAIVNFYYIQYKSRALTLAFPHFLSLYLVEHMSAYYQSCDAFPVAMVTGIDLEDEECVAIMKRVSMSGGK